jgi:polysaccharide deacetylase 2 family uncharacterized protein YibQ
LVAFLLLFVTITTVALLKIQERLSGPPPPDLHAATADLHTLVSGSLLLSGLHPEEVLREESAQRGTGRERWNEYRTEILVGESFPVDSWLHGLQSSLQRAGASLDSSGISGKLEVLVRYRPEGSEEALLVESLTVRTRPTSTSLAAEDPARRGRAALVIDDLGQNPLHLKRLTALGIPLTLSILPDLPHSRRIARRAGELNLEVLLHIPMEPYDFPEKHPGPGALLVGMTDEEMRAQLGKDLDAVPGVVGVNNHMGSRLTADARAMDILMKELKSRNLLFLDSKTSPHSLAFDTAYRYNLPAAQRDIFIDAHDDEEFIRGQIRKLLDLARNRGNVIGIGHPYRTTLDVLDEMREEIQASGVEWVTVSSLVIRAYNPEQQSEGDSE